MFTSCTISLQTQGYNALTSHVPLCNVNQFKTQLTIVYMSSMPVTWKEQTTRAAQVPVEPKTWLQSKVTSLISVTIWRSRPAWRRTRRSGIGRRKCTSSCSSPQKSCSAPPTCGWCFVRGAHAYCATVRPHHCCPDGQVCAENCSAAHPRTHGRWLWRHESRRCARGAQSRHQALCRFLECPPSSSWRRTQQVQPFLWEHVVRLCAPRCRRFKMARGPGASRKSISQASGACACCGQRHVQDEVAWWRHHAANQLIVRSHLCRILVQLVCCTTYYTLYSLCMAGPQRLRNHMSHVVLLCWAG